MSFVNSLMCGPTFQAKTLTATSAPFWFIVRAIKEFVEEEGELPVSGSVPDMTATPEYYVELQRIYKEKAAKDTESVASRVRELLDGVGLPAEYVDEGDITRACANANYMRVVRTKSLAEEIEKPVLSDDVVSEPVEMLGWTIEGEKAQLAARNQLPFTWYYSLMACDLFTAKHGRIPGYTDDSVRTFACTGIRVPRVLTRAVTRVQVEADGTELKTFAAEVAEAAKIDAAYITEDHLAEW